MIKKMLNKIILRTDTDLRKDLLAAIEHTR